MNALLDVARIEALSRNVFIPEYPLSPSPRCIRRPEQLLQRAVLRRAFDDLELPIVRESARRWFLSTTHVGPMSFVDVCESLGLDPTRVRRVALAR